MGCGAGAAKRYEAVCQDEVTSSHDAVGQVASATLVSPSNKGRLQPEPAKANGSIDAQPLSRQDKASSEELSRCRRALVDLFETYYAASKSVTSATADPPLIFLDDESALKESDGPTRSQTMPLISPEYVKKLAAILGSSWLSSSSHGIDLKREPELAPALKTLLTVLAKRFAAGALDLNCVQSCFDSLEEERAKRLDRPVTPAAVPPPRASPAPPADVCAECNAEPSSYCPECEDLFCTSCFDRLHAKGNRALHLRLDKGMAGFRSNQQLALPWINVARESDSGGGPSARPVTAESNFGPHWHAFYDTMGVKYYHNFVAEKSVRRPQKGDLLWLPPPPLPQFV